MKMKRMSKGMHENKKTETKWKKARKRKVMETERKRECMDSTPTQEKRKKRREYMKRKK